MKSPFRVILLVPFAREFDRGLRRGIFEYAHKHGPWVFLEEAPDYLQSFTARERLLRMREWQADGVVVLQNRLRDIQPLRVPAAVSIGMHRAGAAGLRIVSDNEQIGRMGASTLLGLGLRHFAYCGLPGLKFSEVRGAAFGLALEQAGYPGLLYSGEDGTAADSWYRDQRQLAHWLRDLPRPVGIMACNDDRARMLAQVCWTLGIRIPSDVAILGVDNDEQVCRSSHAPLSSIALATEPAGYQAAALLASAMSGVKPEDCTILIRPTHVVQRQSTDALAVEDAQVGRAVRYIRENASRPLRVGDLVPVAGLSRRALQDAFVRSLGRTPMEEIHMCRAERIARLLVETDIPIGKVAEAAGFDVEAHLARFFSRRTGMTPREYRKTHRIL